MKKGYGCNHTPQPQIFKNNSMNQSLLARLRVLLFLTLFLTVCFNISKVKADIVVSTSVPTGQSEALNVGVGCSQFETDIVNNGSSIVHITSLTINHPTGIQIISCLASIGIQPIPSSLSGNVITLDVDLPANQKIIITYCKIANCDIIPNNTSDFSILINDVISISSSISTTQITTNSYPVLFPGIQVNTSSSVNNANQVSVNWRQSFTDSISIVNASSAGKIGTMIFSMKWGVSNALAISNMAIKQTNGITIPVIPVIQGDSATLYIDSSKLSQIGFTNGIVNPSDSFKVIFTSTPTKYIAKLLTTFTCNYSAYGTTCRHIQNETSIKYYVQPYPNPIVNNSRTNEVLGNWCGKNYEADFIVSNNSENTPSNTLLNCYLYFSGTAYHIISATTKNGLPLVNQGDKWYIPADDLDGDGLAYDFAPQKSSTIHVVITIDKSTDPQVYTKFSGARLDSASVSYTVNTGGYLKNITSNITGPTDANAGETAQYSFRYYAVDDNFAGIPSCAMLDIDKAEVIFGSTNTVVDNPAINGNIINGTSPISVTTNCGMSQNASLVILTKGCTDFATIATAIGNTIIQCSGMGGDCFGIFTESVSIDKPTTMNTCQSFTITASGHVDHWCKKLSCPVYKGIIARVYDLSGQLTFSGSSGTLSGITTSSTMTLNNTYASNNGIAWVSGNLTLNCVDSILNTDNFTFSSGSISINGNHHLDDISNINVRVEFGLIDESGTAHYGGWSKGIALTVYDPEPKFDMYVGLSPCNVVILNTSVSAGVSGSSPNNITVNTIQNPAIPGFYYNSSTHQTNVPVTEIVNKPISQNTSNDETVKSIYAICVKDKDVLTIPDGVITYTDYYAGCNTNPITKSIPVGGNTTAMPYLVFHSAKLEQTIANTATWTIQVENTGSSSAPNVTLKCNVDDLNNKINMSITNINGTNIGNNKTYYYNVGTIAPSKMKEVSITASYRNCINSNDTNHIIVTGAWSCETLNQSNFDLFACNNKVSTDLQLQNLAAVMNAVEQYPASNESFGLCRDIPVNVAINNIGRADLDSLGFWIDTLPSNMTLTRTKINWSFKGSQDSMLQGKGSIKYPIDLFKKDNFIISENILGTTSSAPLKSIDPSIQLGFNVQVHCGVIKNLVFSTKAISNCGDEQKKSFRFFPQIKGFEHLNDLRVMATGGIFSTNKGTSTITAKVTNTSLEFVDSAYITVKLPTGVTFVSYIPASGTFVHSVDTATASDGIQTIQFELTKHQNIAAGDSVSVTLTVTDKLSCPPLASTAQIMGTLKRKMVDCGSESCLVEASTKADSLQLKRQSLPFDPHITGPSEFCLNKQTVGTYTVNGDNIASVDWSIDPQAQSLVASGTTATVSYDQTGKYVISALVTSTCPDKKVSLSVQTQIDTKPVVTITPIDSIAYTSWKSDSIRLLSATPSSGVWKLLSAPDGNSCGSYSYRYTASNSCGKDSATITFEVNHCCGTTFNIQSKPGTMPTTDDVWYLRLFIYAKSGKATDKYQLETDKEGRYTITQLDDYCSWMFTYPTCFPESADFNHDGKIDEKDVQILIDFITNE
jgi:hypothetical protein